MAASMIYKPSSKNHPSSFSDAFVFGGQNPPHLQLLLASLNLLSLGLHQSFMSLR